MRKSKFHPFIDKAHMLRSALADAIAWEESRQDAGCEMGDPTAEQETKDRIKCYRAELRRISPQSRTMREVRDAELSGPDIILVSVTDLLKNKNRYKRMGRKK